MRLEISIRASRDLSELHLFGLERYGPQSADAYLAELFAHFDNIASWPFAARERLAMRPPVRLVRQRAHNILYSVSGETVTILRVFHHSANWIDLLWP
jgi:toxin ParE1/3/4